MGALGEPFAADAHDAGLAWGFWKNPLQLMMWGEPFAVDAHDAGLVLGALSNTSAADALFVGVLGKILCG